jgi:hypothetical protein
MASSLPISNRPSKFNWADDDEDEWDFDTWKATADTSAPALDSLPQLQLPIEQDDTPYVVSGGREAAEVAPWSVFEEALQVPVEVPVSGHVWWWHGASHEIARIRGLRIGV